LLLLPLLLLPLLLLPLLLLPLLLLPLLLLPLLLTARPHSLGHVQHVSLKRVVAVGPEAVDQARLRQVGHVTQQLAAICAKRARWATSRQQASQSSEAGHNRSRAAATSASSCVCDSNACMHACSVNGHPAAPVHLATHAQLLLLLLPLQPRHSTHLLGCRSGSAVGGVGSG
jgi:hypothetical protein